MQLPKPSLPLLEYHNSIQSALEASEVPVYFDTSVLMWCLRIGVEAREEFLQWCRTSLDKRIYIPTWSVHELYKHIREGTIKNNASKTINESKKGIKNILEYICITSHDSLCGSAGYPSKAAMVTETRDNVIKIIKILEALSKDNNYEDAIASITEFVNAHIIESDTFRVLESISGAYDVRFAGRVPPGYKDDAKKENTFGDLVFWHEVLQHLKNTNVTGSAIIITNDDKSDWHHKGQMLIGYDGKPKNHQDPSEGFEAKIPHPLLQHEARLAGIQEVIIINMPVLSVVLDRLYPTKFRALTTATHPLGISRSEPGVNWGRLDPSRGARLAITPPDEPKTITNRIGALTDRELAAEIVIPETILPLLLSLTGSLEQRSDALDRLLDPSLISECSDLVLVEVGRYLYRAAATFPDEASDFILRALRPDVTQDQDQANAISIGMFREAYFDENLLLRVTPLQGAEECLFSLQTNERLKQSIEKANSMLDAHQDKLLYIPSTELVDLKLRLRMSTTVDSKTNQLDSAVLNGRELLCEVTPGGSNSLTHLIGSDVATVQQIAFLISRRFAVPYSQLTIDKDNSSVVTWLDNMGLCLLRTDLGGVADEITAAIMK
jgi:hypothetical protein